MTSKQIFNPAGNKNKFKVIIWQTTLFLKKEEVDNQKDVGFCLCFCH